KPAPQARMPQAIVIPEGQCSEDKDEFIAWVTKQWGTFVESELARHRDIPPASREDLRQQVLLVLCDFFDKNNNRGPDDVPAYLETLVDNAARNYRQLARRKKMELGAEVDAEVGTAADPEEAAMLAELWQKLRGYMDHLTPDEREVVEAREEQELSFSAI